MKFVRNSRVVRAALLASVAGMGLTSAGAAFAQDAGRPSSGEIAAQGGRVDLGDALREAQSGPHITATNPDPQILIANPGTPTTARDPNNITGVGQMIVDQGGGFIGICTGTLINPRTVIFAAHCVNEAPANSYGANSGGTAIGFGFETNTRANAPGETDELVRWLLGGPGGAGQYQTNTEQAFYNANYVNYNPISNEPNAAGPGGFLYGDIAMASLDTPAKDIPTWALLFSKLPAPQSIGAAGTGYHVSITGYGNNGTGQTGAAGIDYRRRVAENMIGGLASLGDFEQFLFGPAGTDDSTNPQNLYWLDFDDPRRGTGSASPYDFNAWRDNATPNEGITSQGDSGGPLILDREYARQLVIGVLSGGYTRFYAGQPANGYGTASFYQPLYLYWDWIAANNPYHYVSAVAGNGNWNDASHWVTTVDPNYMILRDGNLVNDVPTDPGAGNTDEPGWGQACFQNSTSSDCLDIESGDETYDPTGHPIGTANDQPATASVNPGEATDDKATVTVASVEGQASQVLSKDNAERVAQGAAVALPAATLANGLPGATNFVPNNYDGDRLNDIAPRYFDVTLSAAGTTTLDTAATVDRFTLGGGTAVLNIAAAGSLTSLMDITQATGTMQVNGALNTPGDYMMLSGGLNGTGTVSAAYFTNIAGTIAPATAGTTGTLTFRGNAILTSAATYMVDLSSSGASDLIRVQATTFNGTTPTNGMANIGGRLVIGFTDSLRAGQTYTILTAEGGVTGTFDTPAALSAILTPTVTYTANAVNLAIKAGTYGSAIDKSSGVQASYGALLDMNRGNAGKFDGIYGPLDLQDAATIRSTLEGLAPTTETTVRGLGTAMVDSSMGMMGDRLQSLDIGSAGGTMARIGQPMRVASNSIASHSNLMPATMIGGGNEQSTVQEGALPENMSAFVAGGYVEGDSRPMPSAIATARDEFDGWYIAGGIETLIDDSSAIGFALSYSKMDSGGAVAAHSSKADLYQGTLYGKYESATGLTLDAQVSAGLLDTDTRRTVAFVGTNYTLSADDSALAFSSEAGIGYKFDLGSVAVKPRAAWRTTYIDFSRTIETGGPVALAYDRQPLTSSQLRGGLTIAGNGAKVKPFITGTYVYDLAERPAVFAANFVGGAGGGVLFQLSSRDRDWAEVAGGLTVHTGSVDVSIAAEATVGRDDVATRSVRGSIGFRF